MGELFGFVSSGPTGWSLRRHPQRPGHYREEGWGLSVFDGPAALTLRQAQGEPDEAMAALLASGRLGGEVGLAYIRRWTHSPRLANCHPFVRELGGREWAFAHNGRLEGLRSDDALRLTAFQPIGSTDSEYAFCVLLAAIAPRRAEPPHAHAGTLHDVSQRIARHGALNYVLATEGCLYAYSSGEYGLHICELQTAAGPLTLADEDWHMALRPPEDGGRLVVAATNRMHEGPHWRTLRAGELALAISGALKG